MARHRLVYDAAGIHAEGNPCAEHLRPGTRRSIITRFQPTKESYMQKFSVWPRSSWPAP